MEFGNNFVIRILGKLIFIFNVFDGYKFFIKRNKKIYVILFFVVFIIIECLDVLFVIDFILVIFFIIIDIFIVYIFNIFVIFGLRSMYYILEKMNNMFRFMKYGVGFILLFIGVKFILFFWRIEIFVINLVLIIIMILFISILLFLIFIDNKRMRNKLLL